MELKELGLSAELNRRLLMFSEAKRLASFTSWGFDDDEACSAAMMAKAGFYSVATKEDPDAVQCFLCGKTLDGWEAHDNPFKEHFSHAKQCPFAKLQLPEESLTLWQITEMKQEQLKNIITKHFEVLINERNEEYENIMDHIEEHYGCN